MSDVVKTGRPRLGSVYAHKNRSGEHFDIQITYPDGSRSRPMCMPREMDEDAARTKALELTEIADRENLTGRPARSSLGDESVDEWAERWFDDRRDRGLSSAEDDSGRWSKWVSPVIGPIAMVAVTRDDVEDVVQHLDRAIRARSNDPEQRAGCSWKSAQNVWGLVVKAFKDAAKSKNRSLRVRVENPTSDIEGPDRGDPKAKAYVFPTEFMEIVERADVSSAWRRAIALNVYLYCRPGELRALTWDDVDIERGLVHIHRSLDREGRSNATKTGKSRRFAIEPSLLPLLRAMHAEANGVGAVIELPDDRHLSRGLRAILRRVGLKREELHARSATQKNLRWYDLRATGITWMAIRGDDPLKIMSRAGHADFKTTQIYIREAEQVREGFGTVFPPLPSEIIGPKPPVEFRQEFRQSGEIEQKSRPNKVEAPGIEPRQNAVNDVVSSADESDASTSLSARADVTTSSPAPNTQRVAQADPVEEALAAALAEASTVGRWDVVGHLARELEARRSARSEVIDLDRERRRRVDR